MSVTFIVGFVAIGVLRCYSAGCPLMARRMFREVVFIGSLGIIAYYLILGGIHNVH